MFKRATKVNPKASHFEAQVAPNRYFITKISHKSLVIQEWKMNEESLAFIIA